MLSEEINQVSQMALLGRVNYKFGVGRNYKPQYSHLLFYGVVYCHSLEQGQVDPHQSITMFCSKRFYSSQSILRNNFAILEEQVEERWV